jgi:DNA helicase II / ATP-dependent DNA helicase PcrA
MKLSTFAEKLVAAPSQSSIGLIPSTPEQERIFEYFRAGTTHAVVNAVAGSGKSHTLVQGVLRLKDAGLRICVFAFNKHIADEMNSKFRAAGITYANACTYNSFGWRACIIAFHPDLDELKTGRIVEEVVEDRYGVDNIPWHQRMEVFASTRKLASLCKAYLLDGTDMSRLEDLADKHNVQLNGSAQMVMELVSLVLKECAAQTAVMDYDDQIWQTVTKHLPVEQFDLLLIDELQDTSLVQQEMALMACPTGRIVGVGDISQAIFGFRGADVEAIPRITERLRNTARGVETFPLTVTRRCPQSHVRLAQAIVPHIQALPDAPEGVIECLAEAEAVRGMRPGDLVLCRTNAPLVAVAYALIRANVKAIIRGRDVGTNLRQLIDKLRAGDSIHTLLSKLTEYRAKELGKLTRLGERGASKVQSLTDRCDCITALTDGVNSVSALKHKIDRIFADFDAEGKPKDAVILGSVHRTKGLEAHTVWVLAPELLPHPMAKQAWEQQQEKNLSYVAATRAKYDSARNLQGRLVFVQNAKSAGVPAIYQRRQQRMLEETVTHA